MYFGAVAIVVAVGALVITVGALVATVMGYKMFGRYVRDEFANRVDDQFAEQALPRVDEQFAALKEKYDEQLTSLFDTFRAGTSPAPQPPERPGGDA